MATKARERNKEWIRKNPEARAAQSKRNYQKGAKNDDYSNLPYSKREIDLILEHKMPDRELAAIIHRSVKAIQIKRARLKAPEVHPDGGTSNRVSKGV